MTQNQLPTVAITIKQPWASLIVLGHKDIENRSWPTQFRGPVLIHASRRIEKSEWNSAVELVRTRSIHGKAGLHFNELKGGGVIGVAEIVDCVSDSDSPWFVGEYGFVLKNARELPFFACKGALGFWRCEYPGELLEGATR